MQWIDSVTPDKLIIINVLRSVMKARQHRKCDKNAKEIIDKKIFDTHDDINNVFLSRKYIQLTF